MWPNFRTLLPHGYLGAQFGNSISKANNLGLQRTVIPPPLHQHHPYHFAIKSVFWAPPQIIDRLVDFPVLGCVSTKTYPLL